jgi:hypothetical protein
VFTLSKDQGPVQYFQPQRNLAALGGENLRYDLGGAGIDALLRLTANESGSVFAETSNKLMRSSLVDSEYIGSALSNVTDLLT